MIRPWKVVLSVALGAALLPGSAMAQTAPDSTGPTITITSPANKQYKIGEAVVANYTCADPSDVLDCAGSVPNRAAIDTSKAGAYFFTVTAHDKVGNASSASVPYSIVEAENGDVGGSAPPTLTLTLGQPGTFAPFVPGVDGSYTTTVTAQLLSTAGD